MGFTTIVMLIISMLMILDSIAFIYGVKKRSWTACILLTVLMIVGILTLAYLWLTSPM